MDTVKHLALLESHPTLTEKKAAISDWFAASGPQREEMRIVVMANAAEKADKMSTVTSQPWEEKIREKVASGSSNTLFVACTARKMDKRRAEVHCRMNALGHELYCKGVAKHGIEMCTRTEMTVESPVKSGRDVYGVPRTGRAHLTIVNGSKRPNLLSKILKGGPQYFDNANQTVVMCRRLPVREKLIGIDATLYSIRLNKKTGLFHLKRQQPKKSKGKIHIHRKKGNRRPRSK